MAGEEQRKGCKLGEQCGPVGGIACAKTLRLEGAWWVWHKSAPGVKWWKKPLVGGLSCGRSHIFSAPSVPNCPVSRLCAMVACVVRCQVSIPEGRPGTGCVENRGSSMEKRCLPVTACPFLWAPWTLGRALPPLGNAWFWLSAVLCSFWHTDLARWLWHILLLLYPVSIPRFPFCQNCPLGHPAPLLAYSMVWSPPKSYVKL